jgi:dipeptidyl aminopeptidase/acylaminoacyl peptidase
LILHGTRDRQVPPANADALAELLRAHRGADVTLVFLEGLNHLFLPAPTGKVAEYSHLPVQTVDPGLLTLIGEWFGKHLDSMASEDVVGSTE